MYLGNGLGIFCHLQGQKNNWFFLKKKQLKMRQGGVKNLANQDGRGKPINFPRKS